MVLDFAKAFDKVPHISILRKMDAYGFATAILIWILQFLSERRQRVLVQGSASGYQRATSGVPQGSVLGPASFLVYINDISVRLSSQIRIFANDSLVHLNFDSLTASAKFQRLEPTGRLG